MDEPTLRCFGPHPRLDSVGSSTVGATTGQPAGTTPHGVGTGCQHPVATPRGVHATPPPPVVPDDLIRRRIVRWQQQPDRSILAHISERGTTCSALLHGKRHPMVTSAATEDAHLSGPMPLRCRSSRSPIRWSGRSRRQGVRLHAPRIRRRAERSHPRTTNHHATRRKRDHRIRQRRHTTFADRAVTGRRMRRHFRVAPRTGWLRSRRRACTGRQRYRPSCPNEATHPKNPSVPPTASAARHRALLGVAHMRRPRRLLASAG
jgi:hypothetical protein